MSTTAPNITTPIITDTNQPPHISGLGALTHLIGTWNSPTGTSATGYNVMPLPQADAAGGYVQKNFPYYEELTIAPIAGTAPNRGGTFTQVANTLFYEQRVYFATNPAKDTGAASVQDALVHAENGSWLHMSTQAQLKGAYGPDTETGIVPPQPAERAYVKQVSVPHGNSILSVGSGSNDWIDGAPTIPASPQLLPFTGEQPPTDPVTYLQSQLVNVTKHKTIQVSSATGDGAVSNITFETKHSKVDRFDTTWYIEMLQDGSIQLQYVQNIYLTFMINGTPTQFIHVDANTLTRAAA